MPRMIPCLNKHASVQAAGRTMAATLIFPSDFPDNCPPGGSASPDGRYYRIVKNDPPTDEDFVSVFRHDRGRAQKLASLGRLSLCETMGLSVYERMEDIVQHAAQSPRLGSFISEVKLVPSSGMIQHTGRDGNSHHTWWLPDEFRPSQLVTGTYPVTET